MYSGSSPQDTEARAPVAPAPAGRAGRPPPPRAGTRGLSDTQVRAPPPPRRPRTRTAGARAWRPRPAPPPTRAPARSGPAALPAAGGASPLACPSVRPSIGRSMAAPATPPEEQVRAPGSTDPASLRRPLPPHTHLPGAGCPAARPPPVAPHLNAKPGRLAAPQLRPSQRSVAPPRTRAEPSGGGGVAVEDAGGCSSPGPVECGGAGVCALPDRTHEAPFQAETRSPGGHGGGEGGAQKPFEAQRYPLAFVCTAA